ncbi:MAG: CDP-glucose 4,6-dehydratase [Alphaproteobacteria bacterium]|nr:CDP-glucose 4,6-dehydratase [Alphaproteobacteria bacterium]
METLVNSPFWHGKRVFVTGHTGFKGAWLTAILHRMGAEVTGYSLPAPTEPNLFGQLGLADKIHHIEGDIRDREHLPRAMQDAKPEILLHLAAQSLVRRSYHHPLDTFDTNVTGTLNVLEAARHVECLRAIVSVTTDKCYRNDDTGRLFTESDPLGGKDPYSASKAAAEIVSQSYAESFFKDSPVALATARAGNVIGGGDWAEDRLIPDVARAVAAGKSVQIRNPKATRPWQHVLEPVCGYLLLAERLYSEGKQFASGWNFGPYASDIQPVGYVLEELQRSFPFTLELDTAPQPHEAKTLGLDITKAVTELGWRPRLTLADAVRWTGEWYNAVHTGESAAAITEKQISDFLNA